MAVGKSRAAQDKRGVSVVNRRVHRLDSWEVIMLYCFVVLMRLKLVGYIAPQSACLLAKILVKWQLDGSHPLSFWRSIYFNRDLFN